MKVEIVNYTPLEVALEAGLICTDSEDKIDKYVPEVFIKRIIESGHESVIEHIVYNMRITDVSRALLQELSRHRHASLSVKSTRWALKKFIGKLDRVFPTIYGQLSGDQIDLLMQLDELSDRLDSILIEATQAGIPNDIVKYYVQESLATKLMYTVNARELRHIFSLRLSPRALNEFRELCKEIYKALPKEHLFMYEDILKGYGFI